MQYTQQEEVLVKLLKREPEFQVMYEKFKETNELRIQYIRNEIQKDLQIEIDKLKNDKYYKQACQQLAEYTDKHFIIKGTDKNFYVSTYQDDPQSNRISKLEIYNLNKLQAEELLNEMNNQDYTVNIDNFIFDINHFDMSKIQSEIDGIIKQQRKLIPQMLQRRILYDVDHHPQLMQLEKYISSQQINLQEFINTLALLEMKLKNSNMNQIANQELRGNYQIIQKVPNKVLLMQVMRDLDRVEIQFKDLQMLTEHMKLLIKFYDQNKVKKQELKNNQIRIMPGINPKQQEQAQNNQSFNKIQILPQQQYQSAQQWVSNQITDNRDQSPLTNNGQIKPKQQQINRFQTK